MITLKLNLVRGMMQKVLRCRSLPKEPGMTRSLLVRTQAAWTFARALRREAWSVILVSSWMRYILRSKRTRPVGLKI